MLRREDQRYLAQSVVVGALIVPAAAWLQASEFGGKLGFPRTVVSPSYVALGVAGAVLGGLASAAIIAARKKR